METENDKKDENTQNSEIPQGNGCLFPFSGSNKLAYIAILFLAILYVISPDQNDTFDMKWFDDLLAIIIACSVIYKMGVQTIRKNYSFANELIVLSTIVVSFVFISNGKCNSSEDTYKQSTTKSSNRIEQIENIPDEQDTRCVYRCGGIPSSRRCPYCKSSDRHEGRPKELFAQNDGAVCRASYNVYERRYSQGYKVYRCPHDLGYHLTTSYPDRRPIETGIILDTNGNRINNLICR